MKKIFLTLCIAAVIGAVIYTFALKSSKSASIPPIKSNTSMLNNKTITENSTKEVIATKTPSISVKSTTSSKKVDTITATSKNTPCTTSNKNIHTDPSIDNKDSATKANSISNTASKNPVSNKSNINTVNTSKSSSTDAATISNTTLNNTSTNSNNNTNSNATTVDSSTFDSSTFAKIKALASPGTAFIANLNSYKTVNGVKYYNVYQYSIDKSSSGWVYDGNYSNFIGARYMSVDGTSLNNQYIQNFDSLNENQKKSTLYNLAKQFTSYFPKYSADINVDMSKTKDIDGYHCYLINWGNKSFYINLSGYIFVNKSQSFY